MSLFSKMKYAAKKAAAPSGTVLWRGENLPLYTDYESLPDDERLLYKMNGYYFHQYHHGEQGDKNSFLNASEEIHRKAYELVKDNPLLDQPPWIAGWYLEKFGTEDQRNEYCLLRLCRDIENLYISADIPAEVLEEKGINTQILKRDNDRYDYFGKHLDNIIHAVCNLMEKEKQSSPLIYPGYMLYQDLMKYCTDKTETKMFTPAAWEKTYKYLDAADEYYYMLPYYIRKKEKDKVSKVEETKRTLLDPVMAEAKFNLQLCTEDELMKAWKETSLFIKAESQARQERIEYRSNLAEKGDSSAQVSLAKDMYYGANGFKKDISAAFLLFAEAEKAGNGEAAYYMGEYYIEGIGHICKDEDKAELYYQKAFDADYVPAIARAAEMKWSGSSSVNRNPDEAVSLYKRVLSLAEEQEHVCFIKKAISRIIGHYSKGDVDENTLALASLACDYARLDAPIVKEADLSALLAEAEKGDYKAIDQLEEYYSWYSRGRQAMGTIKGSDIYENDPDRAQEMRQVAKAFRLMKISMLLELTLEDPASCLNDLAQAYLDQGNREKAEYYTEIGIRHNIPAVLHFAYHNARKLGYDNEDAMEFLQRAAYMGYRLSINALEHLAELEEDQRQRMEWVKKHKPTPPSRSDMAFELEMLERQINLMRGGAGASLDELALEGKLSFADASLLRHYKNKFLDRFED